MANGTMKLEQTIRPTPRKEMSHAYSVKQSEAICKTLNVLQLRKILSDVYLEHLKVIIHSVFMLGYKGKVVNAGLFSEKHRTTVSHFLNNGKWNSLQFEKALKKQVIDRIYRESQKSGEPVFCIVDDTIASHTKPSSQAMHPIDAAYYHQSHLKKCQDYGHQAVGVMLSCNGLSLNYAIILYDKTRSKIKIVQDIINELPKPPHSAYFLCDSWYASNKLIDAFEQKGFETIGALRANRIIYPNQIRQQAKQFAPCIRKDNPNVSLVTVGKRNYYVYRYQGQINSHDEAVVLLSYPENAFGKANALRVFISTKTELSAQEILSLYANRWSVEVFFRSCKQKLAFDKCQLRKEKGITRMWLILSFVHFLCCTVTGHIGGFDEGYHYFRNCVLEAVLVQNDLSL